MRFWDSSAVIPLLCPEQSSARLIRLYAGNPELVVWAFCRTEILSALCRLRRSGSLSAEATSTARRKLNALCAAWHEVVDYERVRDRAERLLEIHPLTAADALQLAAALVIVQDRPQGFGFLTLDGRLEEAARKEGFHTADD